MGGGIVESEEHDSGFKEYHGGDEGGFPLILFPNTNVVISPANVEFGEQGGLLHVINEFRDEGEWIGISDCVGVQMTIILAWAKGSTFLWYKEEGRGLGGFRRYDMTSFEVFFNKRFARLHLCWIERIDFGDFGGEVWVEFYGMVIRMMRREFVVSFL